jgi:hypothetical protein
VSSSAYAEALRAYKEELQAATLYLHEVHIDIAQGWKRSLQEVGQARAGFLTKLGKLRQAALVAGVQAGRPFDSMTATLNACRDAIAEFQPGRPGQPNTASWMTLLEKTTKRLQELSDLIAVCESVSAGTPEPVGERAAAGAGAQGVPQLPPKKVANKQKEGRDKWIYEQCCKGTPHDEIVAALKRRAVKSGWRVVSTKQRIQQIGNEYADVHGLQRPAPRRGL